MAAETEELVELREEVSRVRQELAQAHGLIAELHSTVGQLQAEIERLHADPPPRIKPNTPKAKEEEKGEKKPRRRRAKEQNGARPREQSPTQTVKHKLEQCPDCRYPLQHPQLASKRQVIELPPPQAVQVQEHQLFKSWCPRCGKWQHASAQVDLSGQVVGQSRMGVRIASLIAYLRTTLRMPVRTVREYLLTMHNLLISTGEIVDLGHRVAEAEVVQQALTQLHEQIKRREVVHGDETGWRERGQNGYIWCFCTPEGERYYEYDRSRGGAVAKRILGWGTGSSFTGTLITDFYVAYNDLPCEHQRCWVHLLRDLHKLKEANKNNKEVLDWADAVHKLYSTAQKRLRNEHDPPSSPPSPSSSSANILPAQSAPITQEEREVLYIELMEEVTTLGRKYAQASTHKEHPCHTLCKRLLRHQDELFRFVLQPNVSADNNLAERSVRPLVVMRKISGGSQSPRGSRTRMRLASLFGTWRAKGLNPFSECLSLLSSLSPP